MKNSIVRTLIITLFSFAILSSCEKDKVSPVNSTTIWRGYHHVWNYNHRVNRMGDWLDDISYENGFSGQAYHSAASGIGADKNLYKTFLTSIKCSSDITFKAITKDLIMQGPEETVDSQTIVVTVQMPLVNDPKAIVLINGIDMYSRTLIEQNVVGDGQADKLINLSVKPYNIISSTNGNNTEVTFNVDVTLGGACASPECSSGGSNDFFDYFLSAHFQIITGSAEKLSATVNVLNNNYGWDGPKGGAEEIYREDYELLNQSIQGIAGYKIGFLGIQSFAFSCEKGFGGFDGNSFEYPHMLSYYMALKNLNYDANSGVMNFDSDLFFKNWTRPIPVVSFGGGGTASFNVESALVQIDDNKASLRHYSLDSEVTWWTTPFDPAPPNTEGAINFIDVSMR